MWCKEGNSRGCQQRKFKKLIFKGSLLMMAVMANPVFAEVCHQKQCTIVGTNEDDVLVGTNGDDVICGLAGNDIIVGKKGDDLICGGLGDDKINGGKGLNTLVGGRGNDNIVSTSSFDVIFGNQGGNELHDETGDAQIVPGSHKELVYKEKSNKGEKTKQRKTEGVTISNAKSANNNKGQTKQASVTDATKILAPAHFTTRDNTIYAPDGSVFALKGVNIFPWALDDKNVSSIVDCWSFNAVRLHSWILPRMTSQWKDHLVYVDEPLIFSENEYRYRLYDIAPLIDVYTSQEIVVIVDSSP